MAFWPLFGGIVLASVGPFPVYIFDVLVVSCTGLLFYALSVRHQPDPCSDNRPALWLIAAYVLYQAFVVGPIALLYYKVPIGAVALELDGRLALLLVPFLYYVALKYVRPESIVRLVNWAALLVLAFVLFRYFAYGAQGYWEDNVFRMRAAWGGTSLLFGWLAVFGLLYGRFGLRSYLMGTAGILGVALVNHRSGYVALIVAVGFALLSMRYLSMRVLKVAGVILVAVVLLLTIFPAMRQSAVYSVTTMFNPYADQTSRDRLERSALAWDYIKANPLGDYVWSNTYYLVSLGPDTFEPHNFVIQTPDRQGLIASVLLFAALAYVIRLGWKNRIRSKLTLAALAYLLFYLTFCAFNTNFWAKENAFLLPIAIALILDANRAVSEKHDDVRRPSVEQRSEARAP